jgi:hypothetical protein
VPAQVAAVAAVPVQVAAVGSAPVQVAAMGPAPVQVAAVGSMPMQAVAMAGGVRPVAVPQPGGGPGHRVAPPSEPAAPARPHAHPGSSAATNGVPQHAPVAERPSARLSPVQAALVAMSATPAQAPTASRPVLAAHPAAIEPPRPHTRPGPSPVESLCTAMLAEVRVSVRGRSLGELSGGLSAPPELTQEALALLVARGAIVRRGHKYFAA